MSSLRDQIQAVYDKHGELTPEILVEEARPKDHPLHDRVFDRPISEAAEAYYRNRAQELIVSVRVVYKEADETSPQRSVRAFHAVQSEAGYRYEPLERVVEDEFTRKLLLRDMEREWRQLLKRYQDLEEFLTMVRDDLKAAA